MNPELSRAKMKLQNQNFLFKFCLHCCEEVLECGSVVQNLFLDSKTTKLKKNIFHFGWGLMYKISSPATDKLGQGYKNFCSKLENKIFFKQISARNKFLYAAEISPQKFLLRMELR